MKLLGLLMVLALAGCGSDGIDQTAANITVPDTQLALSANWIVEATNQLVRIKSRASGGATTDRPDTDLLVGFCTGTGKQVTDPRVIYDPSGDRFYFLEALVTWFDGTNDQPGGYCLSVSATNDPTGAWDKYFVPTLEYANYAWDIFIHGDEPFPDYPGLSVSASSVVLTGNVATESPLFGGTLATLEMSELIWIPKSSLSVPGMGTKHIPVTYQRTILPTVADTPRYLLRPARMNYPPLFNGDHRLVGVDGNTTHDTMRAVNVDGGTGAVTWTDFPLAQTLRYPLGMKNNTGANLPSGDNRVTDAFYDNGKVWFVSTWGAGGGGVQRPSLWAQELNWPTGGPVTLGQHIAYDAGSGHSITYPAVAMDPQGDVFIVFNHASTTEDISIQMTGRRPTDTAGTLRLPPTLLKAGLGVYTTTPARWGDYAGAVMDINSTWTDPWIAAEYPKADGTWGTWIEGIPHASLPQ